MKNTFNQEFISHLTILLLGSTFLYFDNNDEEKISSVLLFAGVYILLALILFVVKRIFFKKKERFREISITWNGWKNREDEFKTYGTNFRPISFNRFCNTIYFIYHWQKFDDTSWVCLVLLVRHSFLYNDVRLENCEEIR